MCTRLWSTALTSTMTSDYCLLLCVLFRTDVLEFVRWGRLLSPRAFFCAQVYFPSGAFEWGSSNDQENNAYQKAQTAGWKDVVFVSANYRTGVFSTRYFGAICRAD